MAAFPNIDYSLARAGEEIMLVLQHREGRGPVVVTQLRPTVVWRCADGAIEELGHAVGEGAERAAVSYERLYAAIEGEGLLVAEFDAAQPSEEPKRAWLLGPSGEIPDGGEGADGVIGVAQ